MENNFIILIHKADFIDFFKNGKYNAAACPNVKFNGDIHALCANTKLAETLFKKSNPIEYSIDYLLLHISKEGGLNVLQIKDVISIYALDNSAFSIGIDMNPSVILNPPIWQDAFENFQIMTSVNKALDGVKLVEELFDIGKLSFSKMKKQDLLDTFESVYYETEPEGDLSAWTYLLRYERHENYPKDIRGYFIDALHVFGNISRKTSYHDSMIEKSHKGRDMYELLGDKQFNTIVSWLKEDKAFAKKVKSTTGSPDFMPIAALFLTLKDYFREGFDEDKMYSGLPLDEFIHKVKKYDAKYLKPALYFLGLTLGWDNIYKLMYKRWDLPILSGK